MGGHWPEKNSADEINIGVRVPKAHQQNGKKLRVLLTVATITTTCLHVSEEIRLRILEIIAFYVGPVSWLWLGICHGGNKLVGHAF